MGRGGFAGGFVDPTRGLSTTRTFPVSVTVTAGTNVADNANTRRRREHIQIDPDLFRQLAASNSGFAIYNQVILTLGTYSVPLTVEILEKQASITTVRIGVEALARFPGASLPTSGTLTAYAPSTGVSDATAQSQGLYYETLDDNGSNTNTIVIAPHGGNIESNTDVMAAALKVAFDGVGKVTTVWGGKGYGISLQNSYDHHHISTVDTDPRLNPMLLTVFSRGFARCVGLHGQSASNRIDIGCPASLNSFVDTLVTALQGDSNLSSQTIARSSDTVDIAGADPNNLGNRLAPHYVQIEMGPECRASSTMRAAIVSKLASAYAPL